MVLYVVVCPTREQFCNFRPLISHILVSLDNLSIFFFRPLVFLDVRVQVVVPPKSWLRLNFVLNTLNKSFIYLSLHYLPILPGKAWEIWDQFYAPYFFTISMRVLSSSSVQGPLTISGLRTFCHRWRHWTSVLLSKKEAIRFQFFA